MKILASLFLALSIFLTFAPTVSAQTQTLNASKCLGRQQGTTTFWNKTKNVATFGCIPILFGNVVFWLLAFASTVAIFFIMFGGIKFITSGGDPKQVDSARKILIWAVVGLILVFLSFGIVRAIAQLTGVRVGCLQTFGFDNKKCRSYNPAGQNDNIFVLDKSPLKLII